jgi:hypothetical protein
MTRKKIKEVLDKHQAFDEAHLVKEINDDEFEKLTTNPKVNVVILFYASWDEDKEKQLDLWDDIALEFQFVTSVAFYQMESSESKKAGVSIFPTVKIFPCASYTALQEIKQRAAEGHQEDILRLETLSEKAGVWQAADLKNTQMKDGEIGKEKIGPNWRKLNPRQRGNIRRQLQHKEVPMPPELSELFQQASPVEEKTFKGKISAADIREFVHSNGNPTDKEMLATLVKRSVIPEGKDTGSHQAYQTMVYKVDL